MPKKRGKATITIRWQEDEKYRNSQPAHGWTQECCRYLDFLTTIDISYIATWELKHRYESTIPCVVQKIVNKDPRTQEKTSNPLRKFSFESFPARNPSGDLSTVSKFRFGPLVFVCAVTIQATVFPSCLCGLAALVSRKVFWLVMGSDGTEEEVLGVRPGQGRKNFGICDHN